MGATNAGGVSGFDLVTDPEVEQFLKVIGQASCNIVEMEADVKAGVTVFTEEQRDKIVTAYHRLVDNLQQAIRTLRDSDVVPD